ncbi:MAG: hypothetical protein JNK37_00535 [Verrucomicrobiales bacterium]|nr:hypothetical protein [Verrucomicrobiales bacterium]
MKTRKGPTAQARDDAGAPMGGERGGCGGNFLVYRSRMPNPWTGVGNPYTRQEVLDRLRDTLSRGEAIIAAGGLTGATIHGRFSLSA